MMVKVVEGYTGEFEAHLNEILAKHTPDGWFIQDIQYSSTRVGGLMKHSALIIYSEIPTT